MHHFPFLFLLLGPKVKPNTRAALGYSTMITMTHYFARDEMLDNKALLHYYSKSSSLLYCSEPVLASLMGVDY